jgi:hypothetical protein
MFIEDLKFKMRKITVQLEKLLLEKGINKIKEDSYQPRVFSKVQESICDSKCVLKCVQVFKSV